MQRPEYSSFILLQEHSVSYRQSRNTWLAEKARQTLDKGYSPYFSLWRDKNILQLGEVVRRGGLIQASYPNGTDQDPENIRVVGIGPEAIQQFLKQYGAAGKTMERMGNIFLGNLGTNPAELIVGVKPELMGTEEQEYLYFDNTFSPYFDRLRTMITVGVREASQAYQPTLVAQVAPLPTGDDVIIAAAALKTNVIPTQKRNTEESIWIASVPSRREDVVVSQQKDLIPFQPPAVQVLIENLTASVGTETLSLRERYQRFKQLQSQLLFERKSAHVTPWETIGLPSPGLALEDVVSRLPIDRPNVVFTSQQMLIEIMKQYQENPLQGVNIAAVARALGVVKHSVQLRHARLMEEFGNLIPPSVTDERYQMARAIEVFAQYDRLTNTQIADLLHMSQYDVESAVALLATKQLVLRPDEIITLRNEQVQALRREQRLGNNEIATQLGLTRSQVVWSLRQGELREETAQKSPTRLRKKRLPTEEVTKMTNILDPLIRANMKRKDIEAYLQQSQIPFTTDSLTRDLHNARVRIAKEKKQRGNAGETN